MIAKVKEIKKAIECCKENEDTNSLAYCHRCPFGGHVSCEQELYQKSLALITELESDNERVHEQNGDLSCKLNYIHEKLTNSEIEIDDYKDRIARVEKVNEALSFAVKQGFNDCQKKTLKQFAERLKCKISEFDNLYQSCADVSYSDLIKQAIDETLKEFLDAEINEH